MRQNYPAPTDVNNCSNLQRLHPDEDWELFCVNGTHAGEPSRSGCGRVRVGGWLGGCVAGWMGGCVVAWLGGCVVGWLGGWVDWVVGGWVVGCLGEWVGVGEGG